MKEPEGEVYAMVYDKNNGMSFERSTPTMVDRLRKRLEHIKKEQALIERAIEVITRDPVMESIIEKLVALDPLLR